MTTEKDNNQSTNSSPKQDEEISWPGLDQDIENQDQDKQDQDQEQESSDAESVSEQPVPDGYDVEVLLPESHNGDEEIDWPEFEAEGRDQDNLDQDQAREDTGEEPSASRPSTDLQDVETLLPKSLNGDVEELTEQGSDQSETPPEYQSDSPEESESDLPAQGWEATYPSFKDPVVVYWEDQSFLIEKGRIIANMKPEDSGSFCYAFADMAEGDGPGIMRISGEIKYAPVLARKRAEEMGIMSPEMTFHTYQTIKKDKLEADILYHVLPRTRLEQLKSECSTAEGCVLFDGTSLLLGLLKKLARTSIQAIALHCETSILVVVGNARQIYLAQRFPLFSSDEQELQSMISGVDSELQNLQATQKNTLNELQFIEVWSQKALPAMPETQIPVNIWPVAKYDLDGQDVYSALPQALKKIDFSESIMGSAESLVRPLQIWEKWLRITFLAVTLLLGVQIWLNWNMETSLGKQSAFLKDQVLELEEKIGSYSYDQVQGQKQLSRVSSLINDLQLAVQAPPPGWIWNVFLSARPDDWKVDTLDFSYKDFKIDVQSSGKVDKDPPAAENEFRSFQKGLKEQGFIIQNAELQLGAQQAYFKLSVSYIWDQQGGE